MMKQPHIETKTQQIAYGAMFVGFVVFLLWGLPALVRMYG